MTRLSIRATFIVAALILFSFASIGQTSLNWKKHASLADELYLRSLYEDAAQHYENAWRLKPKKKELIFKAAECYYIIKDYKKAALTYIHVKDDKNKFPMAGLRYARSLKQDGDFDAASREFANFISEYNGTDKGVVSNIVENEIKGCEMGVQMESKNPNPLVSILHLPAEINTPETEFAPFPFNDDVLYFSSTMSKKARIYFSMRKDDGSWKKASMPKNFPKISNEHYGNGTLTPDGNRFYFTICKSVESWGGLSTLCEINVITKTGNSWTPPQVLRDYVNLEGYTTTHPFVIHDKGKEVLFFSSNREGGQGGMDIWYIEKPIDSDELDFTFPVNLGSKINTIGDEITPYYDFENKQLYFSSNGRATLGGHDIFVSEGSYTTWSTPENIGIPYNSTADDFSFVKNKSHTGGFIVSNRSFGTKKISTTHEDIFEYIIREKEIVQAKEEKSEASPTPSKANENAINEPKITPNKPAPLAAYSITGIVTDVNKNVLQGILATLYMITQDNRKALVSNEIFNSGKYNFELESNQNYMLEFQKDGYLNKSIFFNTRESAKLVEDIMLSAYELVQNEVVVEDTEPTVKKNAPPVKKAQTVEPASPKVNVTPAPQTTQNEIIEERNLDYHGALYTTRGQSRFDNAEFSTRSPRHGGTYYKIQISASPNYNPEASKFNFVKTLGRLDTEFLLEKRLYRILVADFFTFDEAKKTLRKIQASGLKRSFIVKYIDGERYGMIYR